MPLINKITFLGEDLNTHIATIGNKQPTLRVKSQRVGSTEFPRFGSNGAPGLEKPTMTIKLGDAGNSGEVSISTLTTMTVTNIDTAIRPCHYVIRGIK